MAPAVASSGSAAPLHGRLHLPQKRTPTTTPRTLGFDAAAALFNGGEFHACHDVVEELWYTAEEPTRTLLHGILQCAVGFHHLFNQRARKVVDTWEKHYNSASKDKKVSFLYLSNDILQNSKRKGGEFVNEFWRVLPGLLKDFYVNGEEEGKKVVGRLIEIWDERKVFGTRIESLKDDILGGSTHTVGNNGNSSNPSSNPSSVSKAVRKDSGTITKKLTVGGMPEKIVTAFQSVLDQHFDEDTALNKCNSAVSVLDRMDKDVDDACTQGVPQASSLISDLQGQEAVLKQCIEQLESVNMARITLINKLREALTEQEAKSELLRNQLHLKSPFLLFTEIDMVSEQGY
ncbi:hypothetical protein E2562_021113 [Oryza meyeriana var. granulata]|uniref:CID domain-containing protein n=1 Tax=Oryza meyeriana var. granulata TaxID=110450 RepID=A0A6G1BMT9_9ORYZ|nr:hypothetical protein E2562_021113 [Oryza meyeriana var. granulata]